MFLRINKGTENERAIRLPIGGYQIEKKPYYSEDRRYDGKYYFSCTIWTVHEAEVELKFDTLDEARQMIERILEGEYDLMNQGPLGISYVFDIEGEMI